MVAKNWHHERFYHYYSHPPLLPLFLLFFMLHLYTSVVHGTFCVN